jgi:uncharacterized protein YidB (DUF937 family)
MSLLNSVMDTVTGKTSGTTTEANPLVGLLGSLFTQSGGLQGMMSKFSQAGLGNVFSSWVGTGQNQPINPDQIQQVLGSDQVKALAAKLGIDPTQVSRLMADQLPKVVDKLTPQGKIDPNANIQQALGGLLPSLLQSFGPKLAGIAQK